MREQLRGVGRELESTRTDAAGMLRVMSAMEKQLAEYAAREEATAQVHAPLAPPQTHADGPSVATAQVARASE